MNSRTGPLPDAVLELIARRFRLLGEPMRLRLIQLLEPGERSVSELTELTGGQQPNVSRHLQVLHEGGLLARRREGGNVLYSVADPVVFELCDLVCRSAARYAQNLSQLTATSSAAGSSSEE